MDEATRHASRWKGRADAPLVESALIERLEQHGRLDFSGAYAYDLMKSPDAGHATAAYISSNRWTGVPVIYVPATRNSPVVASIITP
jgi:hypothetical protein